MVTFILVRPFAIFIFYLSASSIGFKTLTYPNVPTVKRGTNAVLLFTK